MEKNEDHPTFDVATTLSDIDEANKKCVDCGAEEPTYVSINDGVTICSQCASIHSTLGYSISYVRQIYDDWDEYLMNYMLMGSNSKFNRSMSILGLDTTLPINLKYRSKAVDFYRRNLKKKVLNDELLQVDFDNPNDICNETIEKFEEFENYLPTAVELQQPDSLQKRKAHHKFGIFGKIGSAIVKAGKTGYKGLKKAGTFVAHKAQPATTKIKQGASYVSVKAEPAANKIKQGAKYIGHKASPVIKFIGKQVKNGTSFITHTAKNVFNGIKKKIGIKSHSHNKNEVVPLEINENEADIQVKNDNQDLNVKDDNAQNVDDFYKDDEKNDDEKNDDEKIDNNNIINNDNDNNVIPQNNNFETKLDSNSDLLNFNSQNQSNTGNNDLLNF